MIWYVAAATLHVEEDKEMAEQSKRSSQLKNGEHGHSVKKARAQAMPNGVIKREQQEIDEAAEEEEEQEEGEVSQGSGAGAMEEAQINLRFRLTLFHCRSCLLPLKPPTFKCEYGHVIIVGEEQGSSLARGLR